MSLAWNQYDCRRTTRSRRGGRSLADRRAAPAELKDVLKPGYLWSVLLKMAARNGRAPGVDGVRHHDLSKGEWFELFRVRRDAILAGTYRPQPLREVKIAKAGGGTRTLKLAVVIDRVIEKGLADALTPTAEQIFLDSSYGFRPGRDRLGMLATLKVWAETHGLWVLTADDVKKAFDHVPVAAAVAALRRLGVDPALVTLAEIFLRGQEQREVGIAQGGALSPLTLNVLLHYALDTLMPAARGGHAPVLYVRYADNLVLLTRTEQEGRELLERIRSLLGTVDLKLKGDPGETRNLAGKQTLGLLGLRLTSDGNRLTFEVPNQKWGTRRDEDEQPQDLRAKLRMAHREANPTATAGRLVKGWIQAHGPALSHANPRRNQETTGRLFNLLRETGHRHALTRDQIVSTMRTAVVRWEKTVAEARARMTTELPTNPATTPGTTAHATAVIPTVDHARRDETTDDTIQDVTNRVTPDGTIGIGSEGSPGYSSSFTTNSHRPSGRSTALPGRSAAPQSAHHCRARTSYAAVTRSRTHRPRHPSGCRTMPARPTLRPP